MKKALVAIVLIVLSGGVVGLCTHYASSQFLSTAAKDSNANCERKGTNFRVDIKDGKVDPSQISAKRCDTLTITNNDTTTREMAFGEHEKHVAVDGISERILQKGQNLTVTLRQAG